DGAAAVPGGAGARRHRPPIPPDPLRPPRILLHQRLASPSRNDRPLAAAGTSKTVPPGPVAGTSSSRIHRWIPTLRSSEWAVGPPGTCGAGTPLAGRRDAAVPSRRRRRELVP